MKKLLFIATVLVLISTSGCMQSTAGRPNDVDQENICEVDEWTHDAVAKVCKPGQKVVFLPGQWGNEQLPVKFAAVNCDLQYSIAMNNGGVTCVYHPINVAPTSLK
jgi:hypothetical protein